MHMMLELLVNFCKQRTLLCQTTIDRTNPRLAYDPVAAGVLAQTARAVLSNHPFKSVTRVPSERGGR